MKNKFILIIAFLFFFTSISPTVEAFYSPVLMKEAAQIEPHLLASRQKAGVGSFYDLAKKVYKNRKENNEKSLVYFFTQSLYQFLLENLGNSANDFMLLVRYWPTGQSFLTTCLRDDLWRIQILQEQVLNEMFKMAFMGDFDLATQLWNSHQRLDRLVMGGQDAKGDLVIGLKDTYASSYWFPTGQQFYLNCPYGEYEQAIESIVSSLKSMRSVFSGNLALGSIQSIGKLAKQRGIQRARQWIVANQIRLSFGGPQGANPTQLVNGPGLAGLAGDLKREWSFVRELVDVSLTSPANSFSDQVNTAKSVSDYNKAYSKISANRDLALKQMEQAMIYNLSFNNVSEQSLIAIDQLMTKTNLSIKSMYSPAISKQANSQSLCRMLHQLVNRQCTNKTPSLPKC